MFLGFVMFMNCSLVVDVFSSRGCDVFVLFRLVIDVVQV